MSNNNSNHNTKKVQKPNQLPLNYLYIGYYNREITQDDVTFQYYHYDCFISNEPKNKPDNITHLNRLTGTYYNNQPLPFSLQKDNKKNYVMDIHNNIEYTISSYLPADFACEYIPLYMQTPQYINRTRAIKIIEKMNSRNIAISKKLAMYQQPIQEIINQEFGKK